MSSLSLTTKPFFTTQTHFPLYSSSSRSRSRSRTLYLNKASFNVFASSQSQEEQQPLKPKKPQLNSYDLMELKFGRLLGEDPKLTLAKIMGRKANPDASYLDIEKSYNKNKAKFVEVEEVPFDISMGGKSSSKLDGLDLVRPVPAKGAQFQSHDSKVALEIKKPSRPESMAENVNKTSVPNVILRKPTVYKDDTDEDMSSNPIFLHRFQPSFHFPQFLSFPFNHHNNTLKFKTFASPNPQDTPTSTERLIVEPSNAKESPPEIPSKDINRKVAIVSILSALGLFLFTRLDFGVSLKDLTAVALPYEQVCFFPPEKSC